MDVFERTRQLLDHEHMLRWLGTPPSDPRFEAIQRARDCLKRLGYDDYLEACHEFATDTLPGGPYPPRPSRAYDFFCSSYVESK